MKILLIVLLGPIFILFSHSKVRAASSNEVEQEIEREESQSRQVKLVGFESVSLECYPSPNDKTETAALTRICDGAKTDLEFLAAASKVPTISREQWMQNLAKEINDEKRRGPFISSTEKVLRLRLYPSALHVVGAAAIHWKLEAQSWKLTRGIAKSGELVDCARSPGVNVIWDDYGMGIIRGSVEGLVNDTNKSIERSLKKFFTDFIKANDKSGDLGTNLSQGK